MRPVTLAARPGGESRGGREGDRSHRSPPELRTASAITGDVSSAPIRRTPTACSAASTDSTTVTGHSAWNATCAGVSFRALGGLLPSFTSSSRTLPARSRTRRSGVPPPTSDRSTTRQPTRSSARMISAWLASVRAYRLTRHPALACWRPTPCGSGWRRRRWSRPHLAGADLDDIATAGKRGVAGRERAGLHTQLVHHGADERRCDLRDDRVAVGAQASHASGSPMSQRE